MSSISNSRAPITAATARSKRASGSRHGDYRAEGKGEGGRGAWNGGKYEAGMETEKGEERVERKVSEHRERAGALVRPEHRRWGGRERRESETAQKRTMRRP